MWLRSNNSQIKTQKFLAFFILAFVFIVSIFFRTIFINTTPAGFTWDEAALGYNAYSILKTGKDEYGEFLPLIFKSFGDYKPGVYVYLIIPFITLFGLSEFVVRLPSVLLGSLIPIVVYFLVKQIVSQYKEQIALLTALMVSVSPWAIVFSRGAWEANIAFFLIVLGSLFVLTSRNKGKWLYLLGIFCFIMSIYTYQSAKIIAVLIPVGLTILYKQSFLSKKRIFLTGITLIILVAILGSTLIDGESRSRLAVLNQYSYKRTSQEINLIKSQDNNQNLLFTIFHAEDFEYLKTIISRFLYYLSPRFLLFENGSDGRQSISGYGVIHFFELPLILGGLFFMFRKNLESKKIVFLWIIISLLPAALSRDAISQVRSLPLVFPLSFLSGIGGVYIYYSIKDKIKRVKYLSFVILGFCILSIIYNLGLFSDKYFVHSSLRYSNYWLYGYKQVVEMVENKKDKYDQVIFTTGYNQPYIFYLFYTKYDPLAYQKQASLKRVRGKDVGEVERIDNIEFRPLYWPHDRSVKNRLYIGTWLELPDQDIDPKQSRLIETVEYLNGAPSFKVVETLP